MSGTYEVFSKNGDYGYNDKTSAYSEIDFSNKTDDLAEALQVFLEWVTNINLDEETNKVTLTYRYKAKK